MFACEKNTELSQQESKNKRYDRMCLLIKSCVYRS